MLYRVKNGIIYKSITLNINEDDVTNLKALSDALLSDIKNLYEKDNITYIDTTLTPSDVTANYYVADTSKLTPGSVLPSFEYGGFVEYYVDTEFDETIVISQLYVQPNYRCRGIGTELLKCVANEFPHKRLILAVPTINSRAISLYTRLGFIEQPCVWLSTVSDPTDYYRTNATSGTHTPLYPKFIKVDPKYHIVHNVILPIPPSIDTLDIMKKIQEGDHISQDMFYCNHSNSANKDDHICELSDITINKGNNYLTASVCFTGDKYTAYCNYHLFLDGCIDFMPMYDEEGDRFHCWSLLPTCMIEDIAPNKENIIQYKKEQEKLKKS